MKACSIEYLAGLFDGEGTVTLSRRNASDLYRTPTLSLSSTTKELVDVCKDAFGGWIISKKQYAAHHKPAWHWYCNGDAAISASSQLLPYIREPAKRHRMTLLCTQYKSVTVRNGKYTVAQTIAKQTFETLFFHPSDSVSLELGIL